MNIDTLPLPRGFRIDGVALPSTLAMQEQFQQITNGRDLVTQGEPLPDQWAVPVPRMLVRGADGHTFSLEGDDVGLHLKPFVPGTPPKTDAVPPEPEHKPEAPDFWDRQAEALVDKVKDIGKDILMEGLSKAWDHPSVSTFLEGCFGQAEKDWSTLFNPDKMMSIGIGEATGLLTSELMNLWAVDDKSSAGEQIARQLVSQYLAEAARQQLAEQLEQLFSLKLDPKGPSKFELVGSAFSSSGCLLAAKMTDLTSHPGTVESVAARTQLHNLAPVRATDIHKCGSHRGSRVAQGHPTILIEGLFASRVDHQTTCAAKITPGNGSVYYGRDTVTVMDIQEPPPPSAPLPASLPPAPPSAKSGTKKPGTANSDADSADEETSEDQTPPSDRDKFLDWWEGLTPEQQEAFLKGPAGPSEPEEEIKIASSKDDEEELLNLDGSDLTPEQIKWLRLEQLKSVDPESYNRLKEAPEVDLGLDEINWYLKKALKALKYSGAKLPGWYGSFYKGFDAAQKVIDKIRVFNADGVVSGVKEILIISLKSPISHAVGLETGALAGELCILSGVGAVFTPACFGVGYVGGAILGDKVVTGVVNTSVDAVVNVPSNASWIWKYTTTTFDTPEPVTYPMMSLEEFNEYSKQLEYQQLHSSSITDAGNSVVNGK